MKFLVIFMFGLLVQQGRAASVDDQTHVNLFQQELAYPLPSCEELRTQRTLCEHLREARERVQTMNLSIVATSEQHQVRKKKVITSVLKRQFAVVAYDPDAQTWHELVLSMPLVGNSTFQPDIVSADGQCQVTRLKGQTFNKMIFRLYCDKRELLVYASQHLSLPPEWREQKITSMTAKAEKVVYLATPPYLVNEEFAHLGRQYVLTVLTGVLRDLRALGVPSRAYPGRLVADVITETMLLNLLVIEQTDPCLLQDREPGCVRLLPKLLYALDEQVVDAVLTEFVINGLEAYRHICSVAAACGAFQFTNNKTQAFRGTYNVVRQSYPSAQLDPLFTRGTRSFRNSAKAAALLIDLELSSSGTPGWVREAVISDERVGLLFPAAAYNGGASQSRKLAQLVTEYRRLHGMNEFFFESFPWTHFFVWVKAKGLALKKETLGYVKKSVDTWNHPLNRRLTPIEHDSRMKDF